LVWTVPVLSTSESCIYACKGSRPVVGDIVGFDNLQCSCCENGNVKRKFHICVVNRFMNLDLNFEYINYEKSVISYLPLFHR